MEYYPAYDLEKSLDLPVTILAMMFEEANYRRQMGYYMQMITRPVLG